MSGPLTPEREQEIREWLDVMLASQVGPAIGAPGYGDMANLVAEIDRLRVALAAAEKKRGMFAERAYAQQKIRQETEERLHEMEDRLAQSLARSNMQKHELWLDAGKEQ